MYDRQHHVVSSTPREEAMRQSPSLSHPIQTSMTTMTSPSVVAQVQSKTETEIPSSLVETVTPERMSVPPIPSEIKTEKVERIVLSAEPKGTPREPIPAGNRTEELLEDILRQLRASRRETLFDDFSFIKVLSGLLQILVVFCLLVSIWFFMDQTRPQSDVFMAIQYAIVLQLMVVSFYLMRDRK
jgi:hypothetical protein